MKTGSIRAKLFTWMLSCQFIFSLSKSINTPFRYFNLFIWQWWHEVVETSCYFTIVNFLIYYYYYYYYLMLMILIRSCATLLKEKGKIDKKTSGLYLFWSSKSLVTTFTWKHHCVFKVFCVNFNSCALWIISEVFGQKKGYNRMKYFLS